MARGKKVKFPGRLGRAREQRAGHTLTVFKMVEIELGPDNTHNHEGCSHYIVHNKYNRQSFIKNIHLEKGKGQAMKQNVKIVSFRV